MKNQFADNLIELRRRFGMTQEALAERMAVSRQLVARWESGESIPDVLTCRQLAELFEVSLDNLVSYTSEQTGMAIPPRGKHFFGTAVVGARGHIVIPKKAREMFGIQPGDQLLVLGDEERGLALVHQRDLIAFVGMLGMTRPDKPDEEA